MSFGRIWYAAGAGCAFVTVRPVSWCIGRAGSGMRLEVPAGFSFDVSVPRPLAWAFDPRAPEYLRAACVHDWLLADRWHRITAGAVFAEVLAADGVPAWRRLVMWLAVSLYKFR